MCRPIRSLTEGKGYDARHHRLAAFGGAGGQHACSVARILRINEVLIHKYSSILSAYGMALADVVHEAQEPSSETLSDRTLATLRSRLNALQDKARARLQEQGFSEKSLRYERYLNLRYKGTNASLMVPEPDDGNFANAFTDRHLIEFSFKVPDRPIIVDDIRVRGIASETIAVENRGIAKHLARADELGASVDGSLAYAQTPVYFEGRGRIPTAVYKLEDLPEDHHVLVSSKGLSEALTR